MRAARDNRAARHLPANTSQGIDSGLNSAGSGWCRPSRQSAAGYLAPGFRLAHEWRLAGGATVVWLYTKGPAGGVTPGRAPVL